MTGSDEPPEQEQEQVEFEAPPRPATTFDPLGIATSKNDSGGLTAADADAISGGNPIAIGAVWGLGAIWRKLRGKR
ncbi:MAG TPA: hypothetical protein VHK88_02775 [Aquihabitans sp.]|jgi:hypothetical protein|nr:hypothetical protein [Aquihabitans sp.]